MLNLYHSTLSLAYDKSSLYWQWSLSVIHALFVLYCLNIYLLWVWFMNNCHCQWLMPNSYYIWLKQWRSSRLTFKFCVIIIVIIKSFFKNIPSGRMGVVLKRTKNYCSWFSTAGHLVVHHCHLHCYDLLWLVLVCHLSFQALSHFFLTSGFL